MTGIWSFFTSKKLPCSFCFLSSVKLCYDWLHLSLLDIPNGCSTLGSYCHLGIILYIVLKMQLAGTTYIFSNFLSYLNHGIVGWKGAGSPSTPNPAKTGVLFQVPLIFFKHQDLCNQYNYKLKN